MEIGRRDISDVLGCLPDVSPLSNVQLEIDVLICTLGFEDRAPALATSFSQEGSLRNASMILVEYPTNISDNEANLSHFVSAAKKASALRRIQYGRNTYFRSITEILTELNLSVGARVVFDISTCSSYIFYPTMKALMDLDADITLVYSEASAYSPTREEWDEVAQKATQETSMFVEAFENAEFQSIGVDNIYASPLFSEMNPGNRPTTFVAVPNFSAGRMNALLTRDQEINKTSVCYWLIGEPPNTENDWRIEAVRTTNNLKAVDAAKVRLVSTLHYKEMLKALEDIWLETRHNYHMSIGSLGSKMQHLGTYFFLCLHRDVGLLLTEPKSSRTTRYSWGLCRSWQICLGDTRRLRDVLEDYMTFRWKL